MVGAGTLEQASRLSAVARTIKPSGIRQFFDLVRYGADVISLGVGEPDLAPPIDVRMDAVAALIEGQTRYTANSGLVQLRQAIADYLERRIDVAYRATGEVLVTVGVAEGIHIALQALVSAGDDVLIPEPCYVSYAPCAQLAGGRPVPVPLSPGNGFVLTPELLASHLTPSSRVLMLNYPNNPTGAVMNRDQLSALVPLIQQYNLTVISDEIYSELTYTAEPHVSIAALPGMRERTIVLNGFSKTFAMTGWRLGYAAGPEEVIDGMTRIHQHCLMTAPTISQIAGVTALKRVDEVAATAKHTYDMRRKLLHSALNSIGLACAEPGGAFYLFPSVTRTGIPDETFAKLFLEEEHVATIPGSAFGAAGQGYIRCSYAVSDENLTMALERLQRFVNRHRPV